MTAAEAWKRRAEAWAAYDAAVKRKDWAAAERAKDYILAAAKVCNRLGPPPHDRT